MLAASCFNQSSLNINSSPFISVYFFPLIIPALSILFANLPFSPNQLNIFQKSSSAVYASCANFLTLDKVLNNPLILLTEPNVAPKSTSFNSRVRSPSWTCELTTPSSNNSW